MSSGEKYRRISMQYAEGVYGYGRKWRKTPGGSRVTRRLTKLKRDRARVVAALGGACSGCGRKTDLHVHHKRHDGQRHREKSKNIYADMLGSLHLYALYCRSCHERHHAENPRPPRSHELAIWFASLPWE